MGDNLKSKVVKGAAWAMLGNVSTKVIAFGVTLVLARMLTPNDYGTVALLTIFISIADCISRSGMGSALVQKKDADELDFNSVFYVSVGLSSCFYMALFVAAPCIAAFYRVPELTMILRVWAVVLVFHAVNSVQAAELSRRMRFDVGCKTNVICGFVRGGVGVGLACAGWGPWALVWSDVIGQFCGVLLMWKWIAWRPSWLFSWPAVGRLWGFGWKLMASGLLDTIYSNVSGVIIGRFYSKADLAFITKGRQVPDLAMNLINSTLTGVSFPALSKLQDQREKVREAMRRLIQCSTFLVFPMLVGCAVCAERLVPLMFGEQWRASIPYVQIYCFSFALWPFHAINLQAMNALGRSDLFFKLEIVKAVLGLLIMSVSIRYGILAFVLTSAFVTGPLCVLVNAWPNRKLMRYTIGMQVRDVFISALLSVVMGGMCWLLGWWLAGCDVNDVVTLGAQVVLGVGAYAALAASFKPRPYLEYKAIILPLIKRRFAR